MSLDHQPRKQHTTRIARDLNGNTLRRDGRADLPPLEAAAPAHRNAPSYHSLFQQHPDAIFAFDRERRLISLNPAAERLSGYTNGELLGRLLTELLAPPSRTRAQRALNRAARGQIAEVRVMLRRKDGERLDLRLALQPDVAQGALNGGFGIVRQDGFGQGAEADRSVMLAHTADAERRAGILAGASAVLDASVDSSDSAGAADADGTLAGLARLLVPGLADWCAIDLAAAGGVRRIVGESAALGGVDSSGGTAQIRSAQPEQANAERLLWVIRHGRPVFVPEMTAGHLVALAIDDEDLRRLQWLGINSFMRVPLSARGQTFGAIAFASAASGRRFTKADLALAEDLARRLGLAVDSARLDREVQRAVRARDEFLAALSHDLRTPLTSIKAFAQMLGRRAGRGDQVPSAAVIDTVNAINEAVSRIAAQLNEVLDRSRLHAGRPLQLERRPTDLVALCRRLIAAQQDEAADCRIALEAEPPGLIGMWDAARLERALGHLLANALKYSTAGSTTLITVGRVDAGGQPSALLRVIDHGIGIPERDLPHVIERFFGAGNARDRAPDGGSGLAETWEIVRQHGGDVTIASREGQGTTVTVTLPLGRQPEAGPRV
ncbi:MAG TPA: PAS domain-containing sensor histidine kinase [Dehalococcoidia bacterium]|nr:PAS domain-containing sensor histidine kinase [Dehalococcoidia bacterium]